jgi:hypothetical protein
MAKHSLQVEALTCTSLRSSLALSQKREADGSVESRKEYVGRRKAIHL